jgi:hypothetical protein
MNIIDAVKSGLPFKRKGSEGWCDSAVSYMWGSNSLLATDWEVQEQTVTITKAQLRHAWNDMPQVEYRELEKELFK